MVCLPFPPPCPAGVLSLELDVVHQPHTVSEFEPHGKQTLKPDTSHYHFDTAPGVRVDAEALLKSLQETAFGVEGGGFVRASSSAEAGMGPG